jgi:hypothetical protein
MTTEERMDALDPEDREQLKAVLMEWLKNVEKTCERLLEETQALMPITQEALDSDTTLFASDAEPGMPGSESYAVGWRRPDEMSEEDLSTMERELPEAHEQLAPIVEMRRALLDGLVPLINDEGERVYKYKMEITLGETAWFKRFLNAHIERQEEELEYLQAMLEMKNMQN